ncbi:MAG: hypothetical protein VX834_09945, partial [Myxococcota bacterium]|nr:hypothetical protein [Myxococcota bacterium]
MPLRPIPLVALVSLTLTACAQPSITVDETVTGIEVAFSYDSALALDQVEVSAWTEDRNAAFEPFLLPEEPILLEGTEQSFALLLAEELAGQTIRLELVGLSAGEAVAAGQGNVTVALGTMTPVSIALSPEEVCDLDEDRDGICDTEDPCIDLDADGIGLAGTDLSGCLHPIEDSNDHDSTVCADTDGDSCDDCSLGGFDPSGDGPDGDGDGICDQGDACTDLDGDGFGTGTLNNADCLFEQNDIDDSLATRCLDSDQDSCDDCASGSFDPSDDGSDLDSDGLCDMGDTCTDIDDDGVGSDGLDRSGCDIQIADTNDYDATLCADTDADGCDDCVQGHYDPMNDGEDTDGDGICNRSDTCTDLDGDGLGDGTLNNEGCIVATLDAAPEDPFQCADTDADSCDDCLSGLYNTLQDGEDADEDGICDASDLCTDLDRDGLGTGTGGNIGCLSLVNDSDDTQAFACADLDADGCDDCAAGSWNPDDDGLDDDSDGLCNAGDTCTDVDGDGIGNGTLGNTGCVRSGTDSNDLQGTICLDSDSDGCDDCSSGTFAPMSDGSDLDSDGICDFTDRCIDMDGDGFGDGSLGNETCPQSLTDVDDTSAQRCFDTDQDGCDDCSNGSFNPTSDGADGDNDGICDLSDRCTDLDGDGLGNGNLGNTECITTLTDINDNAPGQCYDSDGDTCDDCSQTNIWNPGQD